MDVAVDPRISILLDIYGEMLTDKERNMLDLYYNDDLSLQEIADNEAEIRRERIALGEEEKATISRQGVRDTIKRAEAKLDEWESKLRLAEKAETLLPRLEFIAKCARDIIKSNTEHGNYREINEAAAGIIETADSLHE